MVTASAGHAPLTGSSKCNVPWIAWAIRMDGNSLWLELRVVLCEGGKVWPALGVGVARMHVNSE